MLVNQADHVETIRQNPCLRRTSALSTWSFCGFLFWVPAQFGLCVEVVLLDTELEVIPFFAATAVFPILGVKAGK